LRKDREAYHKTITEREDVLQRLVSDCNHYQFDDDESVLLCFTCDPYQQLDSSARLTREALKIFRRYNVKFKTLTKFGIAAARDFDLYKDGDSFGTTLTFTCIHDSLKYEPKTALPKSRMNTISYAHNTGINTWVSLEPVIDPEQSLDIIKITNKFVDHYKVGTINYNIRKHQIDWPAFVDSAIQLFNEYGSSYYIKEDLRKYLKEGVPYER
jgi:DNA repair photolyase